MSEREEENTQEKTELTEEEKIREEYQEGYSDGFDQGLKLGRGQATSTYLRKESPDYCRGFTEGILAAEIYLSNP